MTALAAPTTAHDVDEPKDFAELYAAYWTAVAARHGAILAAAGAREAAGDPGAQALRELAGALEAAADALTGLAVGVATAAKPRDLIRAHQVRMTALVVLGRAEQISRETGETPDVMVAGMRLLTAAEQTADAVAAAKPASFPSPAPAPAGSTLAGAA